MFKIYDGRDTFYQWDIDRKLIVDDATITQVHFCNRTSDCSLVCDVYTEDGQRLVNVPDIILQNNWDINVYAYDSNYTKHSTRFRVIARSKPENYVYTPEELKTWEQLDARIDEIEEKGVSDETVAKAVEGYLNDNPITGNVLSVNGKQGAVELTAADVGALPADTLIPSTVGLATEEYVNDAIASSKPDLTNYATKNDISGLATTNYVDEKVSNVKVDLTGYATESFVSEEIAKAQLAGGDVDLSGYYTKSETDTKISEAVAAVPQPDLKGYATEKYVDEAIANIPTTGGSIAVDGETIIQYEDGTISTAIGGFIEPGEEYYTWEGSVVPSDSIDITNEAADLKELVSMDGENVYITYTIDGEEYEEEQFIIQRINAREAELVNEDEGILFRIILRPVAGKTLTVEFEGEALTALKIVGEEQYNTIDARFIGVGTGLTRKNRREILLDDNYVNTLIADYMTTNYPSAEEVSY